jgi:hypothetical protein
MQEIEKDENRERESGGEKRTRWIRERERERPNGEGEESGRSDPIFWWPDADFRRAKVFFRPINEDPKPRDPKTQPCDPKTREEDPVLPIRFPATFPAESVAFLVDLL